jgi:hypothetical protein
MATAVTPKPTLTNTFLSPELQLLLFKNMPLEDAVCLSLTNKSSWEYLKAAYPNNFPLKFTPIRLYHQSLLCPSTIASGQPQDGVNGVWA